MWLLNASRPLDVPLSLSDQSLFVAGQGVEKSGGYEVFYGQRVG